MSDPGRLQPMFAYGPAPGVELIPYFLGLVAWAGLALSAVLLAPIAALIRRLRGDKGRATNVPADQADANACPAATAPMPESRDEAGGPEASRPVR